MLLEFSNVKKVYADSEFSLDNISFSLKENEILGLIGKNGTGKSSILKMTNGLIEIDGGEITYLDESVSKMNNAQLRNMRKNVSYIFQNSNLLENKTVYYHLSLVYKLSKNKVNESEIDEILNFLDMKELKHSYCKRLSGGQRQKVAIAMAILQKPKIILCDEISASLDTKSENEIYNLLTKLCKDSKISVMLVSHNLEVLKNICDRVLILKDGTIIDEIMPNKSSTTIENDYYKNLKEVLNA